MRGSNSTTHRPDEITVRDEAPERELPPEGTHSAVCVDVIDLGTDVDSFQGGPERLSHKIVLVFQIDERNTFGDRFELSKEMSLMFGKKATLRKFIEGWRGRAYTDDEARKEGAPLHKLVGAPCMLTVAHKVSASSGKAYANVMGAAPLPKQMREFAIEPEGYGRADFWTTKKEEYAAKTDRFLAEQERKAIQQEGNKPAMPSAMPQGRSAADIAAELEAEVDETLPF